MKLINHRALWIAGLVFAFLLAGCSQQSQSSGAVKVVESYVQALVAKDPSLVSSLSCADWEEQALLEVDSLEAVETSLDNLSCQEAGTDGEATLVNCTGKIVMSYNGENQEIDLSKKTYRTLQEGGDWRMCGYK
jgi:hypothetical protein